MSYETKTARCDELEIVNAVWILRQWLALSDFWLDCHCGLSFADLYPLPAGDLFLRNIRGWPVQYSKFCLVCSIVAQACWDSNMACIEFEFQPVDSAPHHNHRIDAALEKMGQVLFIKLREVGVMLYS